MEPEEEPPKTPDCLSQRKFTPIDIEARREFYERNLEKWSEIFVLGDKDVSDEALADVTNKCFEELEEERDKELQKKDPTFKGIPCFFKSAECTRPILGMDINESRYLTHELENRSRSRMLDRRKHETGCVRDFVSTYSCAWSYSNYNSFKKMPLRRPDVESEEELERVNKVLKPLFGARSFCKFRRHGNGCINLEKFWSFLQNNRTNGETRTRLTTYECRSPHGTLGEKELENFIFDLIGMCPNLCGIHNEFYPFYVFTAARKFFFFLDMKRTLKIVISDLLTSNILKEFFEMRKVDSEEVDDTYNWFSQVHVLKVYGAYLELDVNGDGMLSPSELLEYRHDNGQENNFLLNQNQQVPRLTEAFVGRVFETALTYKDDDDKQEMDYKTFLDFCLAFTYMETEPGIRYFFRLLDMNEDGKITPGIIGYFLKSVQDMQNLVDMEPRPDWKVGDVLDEIFDMINPRAKDYITLDDLLNGGNPLSEISKILYLLWDPLKFHFYEHRENLYALKDFSTEADESELHDGNVMLEE